LKFLIEVNCQLTVKPSQLYKHTTTLIDNKNKNYFLGGDSEKDGNEIFLLWKKH